ncbi:MAG TPA: ferritin-like domain-containing protein [Blastocatellia bacterium]|nr:ferritin-like domain-containing protein [Blastocatellia bacterium]
MSLLVNIEEIRARARKQIEDGAVTQDYGLDRERVIEILNAALATEIICMLRYRYHYFVSAGIHSAAVAQEFLEHSNEEQQHADMLADRITQLGGNPEMNPAVIPHVSHSEYKEGESLGEMIREDLVAERIAIETYREMVSFFGEKDPTSRRLIEEILATEEQHADEFAKLLSKIETAARPEILPIVKEASSH